MQHIWRNWKLAPLQPDRGYPPTQTHTMLIYQWTSEIYPCKDLLTQTHMMPICQWTLEICPCKVWIKRSVSFEFLLLFSWASNWKFSRRICRLYSLWIVYQGCQGKKGPFKKKPSHWGRRFYIPLRNETCWWATRASSWKSSSTGGGWARRRRWR